MSIGSSLALRITAILLGGFVLLQMLVWAVMALPFGMNERQPYSLPRPAQVRAMAEVLENAPPARRATLLETFNGSLYTVRVLAEPPPLLRGGEGREGLRVAYVEALPGRTVEVTGRPPRLRRIIGDEPRPARFFRPITLIVTLRDSNLLVIDSRPSAMVRAYLRRRSFLGAIGGILVLAALALAVRQTTRPLVRMSQRVRRLASDLDAPDLPVSGSREVRDLSVAFNEMKARIGDLMAERTRVLAAIAHDMRTYLTRLRLRAEFINDPAQRAKATTDLDEMAALLDDTLLFARTDAETAPATSELNVTAELEEIVALWRETDQAVRLEPVGEGLTIRASRLGLRRMLGNLIDNGLRHAEQVTVSAVRAGNGIEIVVADNGPGVPTDALARLGEPFGRLDPSRDRQSGGAGLGLAIVRALAEREGAELSFANRPTGGFAAILHFRV